MTDWQTADAVAAVISAVAVVAGTVFIVAQLRGAAKDRYFTITSGLFDLWHSADFQDDQLYLLHKFSGRSWEDLVRGGRGERGERALYRVGAYYDRVGHLIERGLVDKNDILPTVGGDAIRVWRRIEPLVAEARVLENTALFQHFESVLPACHECYAPLSAAIPAAEETAAPDAAVVDDAARAAPPAATLESRYELIDPAELDRLAKSGAITILDVSRNRPDRRVKGALRAEPNDSSGWLKLAPPGKAVATYCT